MDRLSWGAQEEKGGLVPWGPSYQRTDGSFRLHTFAPVLGLTLVSLAKLALSTDASSRAMVQNLAAIRATLPRTTARTAGRRPTVMLAPELTSEQRRAVKAFELERWAAFARTPGRWRFGASARPSLREWRPSCCRNKNASRCNSSP